MNQEQGEAARAVILAVTEAASDVLSDSMGKLDEDTLLTWGDLESVLDRAEDILIRDTRLY